MLNIKCLKNKACGRFGNKVLKWHNSIRWQHIAGNNNNWRTKDSGVSIWLARQAVDCQVSEAYLSKICVFLHAFFRPKCHSSVDKSSWMVYILVLIFFQFHWEHPNYLSFLCWFSCVFRSAGFADLESHWEQLNSFSFWFGFSCILRSSDLQI